MTFKKHNPGCPCDCGEVPCSERCLFKCIGDICSGVCNFKIDMPIPDTVGSMDENPASGCVPDPEECVDSAPCYACVQSFDGVILSSLISAGGLELDCDNWTATGHIATSYFSLGGTGGRNACWMPLLSDCPYVETDFDILNDCWQSRYIIDTATIPPVLISGTWDGSCGEIEIKIQYYVVDDKCQQTIPIPDPCGTETEVRPATKYEHTFRLNYCTCEELYNDFTYIGVTSENNCRGETVPDPCNFEDARIYLPQDCIRNCPCYDCDNYSGSVSLSVTGPVFNGTIGLIGGELPGSLCRYEGSVPSAFCLGQLGESLDIKVELTCFPCDQFQMKLYIDEGFGFFSYQAESNIFSCGDAVMFTTTQAGIGRCDYADHSFSLS